MAPGAGEKVFFLRPYIKTINGKSFMVDQILRYGGVEYKTFQKKSGAVHVCPVSDMVILIFMYKNKVQFYSNNQGIRDYDSEGCSELKPGPYNNFETIYGCGNESGLWPNSAMDGREYFYQRWRDKPDADAINGYANESLWGKFIGKSLDLLPSGDPQREKEEEEFRITYDRIVKDTAKRFRPLTDRELEVLANCDDLHMERFRDVLHTVETAKDMDGVMENIFKNCSEDLDPCTGITRENSGPGDWQKIRYTTSGREE